MTIRESLNILDTKAIDGEGKFLDLRNLYEAANLDYEKKKKLKELIDRNEDPEVIAAYIINDDDKLKEALIEEDRDYPGSRYGYDYEPLFFIIVDEESNPVDTFMGTETDLENYFKDNYDSSFSVENVSMEKYFDTIDLIGMDKYYGEEIPFMDESLNEDTIKQNGDINDEFIEDIQDYLIKHEYKGLVVKYDKDEFSIRDYIIVPKISTYNSENEVKRLFSNLKDDKKLQMKLGITNLTKDKYNRALLFNKGKKLSGQLEDNIDTSILKNIISNLSSDTQRILDVWNNHISCAYSGTAAEVYREFKKASKQTGLIPVKIGTDIYFQKLDESLNDDNFSNRRFLAHSKGMSMRLKRSLNESSYGGAFDIEDDQYFTRDDLDEAHMIPRHRIVSIWGSIYHNYGKEIADKAIKAIQEIEDKVELEKILKNLGIISYDIERYIKSEFLSEDLDDTPDQGLQVLILGKLFDADPSRWQQAVEDWGYDITPYTTADEFLENVDTLELLNRFAELVKNNDYLNSSWYELFNFTDYDSNPIEENLKESASDINDWILMYLKHHPFDSADEMIEYISEYEDIDALEDRFRTDVIGAIEDYFEDNLNESLNESVISFKDFLTGIEEATTEDEMLNILERFDTIPTNYKISKEQYRTFMKAWRDKIKQIRQSNM